jgi:transposase
MRGIDIESEAGFYMVDVEAEIPQDHPLRAIRRMMNQALDGLWADFEGLYSKIGRPSIPPERLLRGILLEALYAIRSETQLMEQLKYNLLYRWFVGLGAEEGVWDASVYSKNRDRLLQGEVTQRLLEAVLAQARAHDLLSADHFTADGTLLKAWAGRKSFVPKHPEKVVGTGSGGKKCLRDTHESRTDPQARLYKKSTAGEAKPCYLGHVIIENRRGLVVGACATQASTTAEREAALDLLDQLGLGATTIPLERYVSLGADKLYQEQKFIEGLRERHVVPHVAEYEPSTHWPNFLTEPERQDPRFGISQRKRKLVERVFGWGKLDSVMGRLNLRGRELVDGWFRFVATVYNLVRMVKLIPA